MEVVFSEKLESLLSDIRSSLRKSKIGYKKLNIQNDTISFQKRKKYSNEKIKSIIFSLDKNYFAYSMVVEQLKTEGWQFFGLSGKYEDYKSHQDAYKVFSKSIESIKRKQVEQEFANGKGDGKKKKFDYSKYLKKTEEK